MTPVSEKIAEQRQLSVTQTCLVGDFLTLKLLYLAKAEQLRGNELVVPSMHGAKPRGAIKTFSFFKHLFLHRSLNGEY